MQRDFRYVIDIIMVVKNKVYIWSWKKWSMDDNIIICKICLNDIPREVIKRSRNGKDYVNFVVWTRKSLWINGETHWLYIKTNRQ